MFCYSNNALLKLSVDTELSSQGVNLKAFLRAIRNNLGNSDVSKFKKNKFFPKMC